MSLRFFRRNLVLLGVLLTAYTPYVVSAQEIDKGGSHQKVLAIPMMTKVPIIFDSIVNSDTSHAGEEFSAKISEDLTLNGSVVVPAGSVVKGRIADIEHFKYTKLMELKFETITTSDNHQLPICANLVTHGGILHVRRGVADIAIDTATVSPPLVQGILLCSFGGSDSQRNAHRDNSLYRQPKPSLTQQPKAQRYVLPTGFHPRPGVLIARKGKRIDLQPGDELKLELADELFVPMNPPN
jgi:hypothetical protein